MAIVEMEDFKEFMHIQHDHEDLLIESLLEQAERAAADWCREEEFDEDSAPGPVKLAVMMYAGYMYGHRSEPEEKGYAAMRKAFRDLLSPHEVPEKMF